MIECQKCKGLNTKESIVCGFCGTKLEEHEGARPINTNYEEKNEVTEDEWIEIILCSILVLSYVIAFNIVINAILGGIGLFIAKRRNYQVLKVLSLIGISLLGGTIALYAVLWAWGLA